MKTNISLSNAKSVSAVGLSLLLIAALFKTAVFAQDSESAVSATSTTTSTAELPKAKSKYKAGYLFWGTLGRDAVQNNSGEMETLNRITLQYDFNSFAAAIRPQFLANYDLAKDQVALKMDDTILQVSKAKIPLPFDMSLTLVGRYYAPTGETARQKGRSGQYFGWAKLNKELGSGWSLDYDFVPVYYAQNSATRAADGDLKANAQWRLDQGITAKYQVSKPLSVSQSLMTRDYQKYNLKSSQRAQQTKADPQHVQTIEMDTLVEYAFSEQLSLTTGLTQSHNVKTAGFSLFADNETIYNLILEASF